MAGFRSRTPTGSEPPSLDQSLHNFAFAACYLGTPIVRKPIAMIGSHRGRAAPEQPCHTDSCLRGCHCLDRPKNCAAIQRCFWHTAANYAGMRKKRAGDGPSAVKSQNALQSQAHSATPAQRLLSNGWTSARRRARKHADRVG